MPLQSAQEAGLEPYIAVLGQATPNEFRLFLLSKINMSDFLAVPLFSIPYF